MFNLTVSIFLEHNFRCHIVHISYTMLSQYEYNQSLPMHTCDNLMMAMREICCSDEGDQGLNEGDFRSYKKVYCNDLSKSLTPFILVDYPTHNHTISIK